MQTSQPITAAELAANERFQQFCSAPSPQETRYWQQWQVEHQVADSTMQEAKALVHQLQLYPSPAETQQELARLQQAIQTKSTNQKVRRILRRPWLQAAAILLLLTAGFGVWKMAQPSAPQLVSYDTPFGETQEIKLTDGTTITLNANSNLKHATTLNYNGQREIWLSGEAYFEVAHRPKEPFIVHTTNGDIQVLGTSFNVIQRPNDFELTLVEGKVQLELPDASSISMLPGEQISILDKKLSKVKVNTDGIAAWRNNQMNFRNVTIARVIAQIEHDFGWTIQVNNKALLDLKVNAQIPENNPALLFEALAAIYDLSIQQTAERQYILE
ncbi:MAG: FecR domain-containing protein [Bacteroidota bacterium]